VSSSQAVLRDAFEKHAETDRGRHFDFTLLLGIAIAVGAAVLGMASTGVGLSYFLQPTGIVIVLGGTMGVLLVTTPGHSLINSARRVVGLFSAPVMNREALLDEIAQLARLARTKGLLAIEPLTEQASDGFLRDALLLALDVNDRAELAAALETELRLKERQGETDAKALEVAGSFAPTLGILGTVVGLIEVMRQFSNLQTVGYGIGTAFVSTIYGLALANLILLPAAHRVRARVAENFEIQEMIIEGVLCLVDQVHPSLIRRRLSAYLRAPGARDANRIGNPLGMRTESKSNGA
jgi:chemotaxis protein MotA